VSWASRRYLATMSATKHRNRDAIRWLDGPGGRPAFVSLEAVELLQRRLTLRRRVALKCGPLFLLAGALVLWNLPLHDDFGVPRTDQANAARYTAAGLVLAIGLALASHLGTNGEGRIAADLTQRLSRGRFVPVTEMLGPLQTAYAIGTFTVVGTVAVELVWVHDEHVRWTKWIFLVAFVLASSFAARGISQVSTRPTIATDVYGLAIDERLRSQDAFEAIMPLQMLACVLVTLVGDVPSWLGWQALIAFLVLGPSLSLVQSVQRLSSPHPKPAAVDRSVMSR
jgi:hypothetical protein